MIFAIALLLLVTILALPTMFVVTPQNSKKVIETFGRYARQTSPGLSMKLPFPFQTASGPISLRTQQVRETVGVMSSDKAFVLVPISVQFRVDASKVFDAHYKLEEPIQQIKSYLSNSVRATASGKTFSELFQARDAFRDDIEETLKDKMSDYGYVIVDVLVDDPQPSEEVVDAFNRVIAAERLREAAMNEGEAEKIKAVKTAEAEQLSLELRGRALSNFRKTLATGNSEAIKAFVGETGLTAQDGLMFMTKVNEMEQLSAIAGKGGQLLYIGTSDGGQGAAVDAKLLAVVNAAVTAAVNAAEDDGAPARDT